ncbi:MAG: urate hydroxylase PuuD, partial [Actinomycetota bacterium]|nr:urate hydroxylase PuuD [Actinomycetota bacterium]
MDPYLRDVLDVLLRMLHVTAGIAWIGASFYFVRLDLSLRAGKRAEDADKGIAGEFWGVHGGGLYHSQKYRLAPAELPEPLHWFKWEAYTTWLSGFALMVVLYYFDAEVRLVDPTVADLADWAAIALSIG